MNKEHFRICNLLVVIAVLGACSSQDTEPTMEFGETVRSVMESQIHDHEAAMHPSPDAVEGGDPYRLDAALEVYRTETAQPDSVQQPITINTGNQ